ncbi:MAG: DUF5615 family PIN-like protein [Chloroflexi bacterium]|nr:DUF5615 family PIN-like protein [Chloroflexota bacterium]
MRSKQHAGLLVVDPLRFYLDENVEIVVAEQLRRRGVDVLTAREAGGLGEQDADHLARAVATSRVLCTYDYDFVAMAAGGIEHCGIIVGISTSTLIGDWVRFIDAISAQVSPEAMRNVVRFVPRG